MLAAMLAAGRAKVDPSELPSASRVPNVLIYKTHSSLHVQKLLVKRPVRA